MLRMKHQCIYEYDYLQSYACTIIYPFVQDRHKLTHTQMRIECSRSRHSFDPFDGASERSSVPRSTYLGDMEPGSALSHGKQVVPALSGPDRELCWAKDVWGTGQQGNRWVSDGEWGSNSVIDPAIWIHNSSALQTVRGANTKTYDVCCWISPSRFMHAYV